MPERPQRPKLQTHMVDDKPVALALITRTQRDMLGSSLKVVFEIKESSEQFAELLSALDIPEATQILLASLKRA